jgi:hypothetical protein
LRLYRNANLKEVEHFLENTSFDSILSEYFHAHQGKLQGGYLDWLFIDLFAARKAFALMKDGKRSWHNLAYNLFNSLDWKMILWVVVTWLLIAQDQKELDRLPTTLIFLIATTVVCFVLMKLERITPILSELKLNKHQLEQVDKVYQLLSGPVLYAPLIMDAFKKTAEAGVMWDHRIFYLLENVIKRDEKPWSVGKP